MPLYEYKCDQCGGVFEIIQKFSDEPLTIHEKCGGPVHRLVSAPALQFKGSGWYITDYAKSNGGTKKEASKNDSGDSSKPATETKSEKSSDSSSSSSSTPSSSSSTCKSE